jgi:TATA-box binding protein (TBP) (component of TFIID and TFIIIB)
MESTICKICGNPTFLCQCDSSWQSFEKVLSEDCKGKEINNVKYTDINVSTMTVCFNFNQHIDLVYLKQNLPKGLDVNFNPGSKKSKVPKKKGTDSFYNSFDIKLTLLDYTKEPGIFSNISIFIFPNGKVKAAGIKTISTINIMIDELIELITLVCKTKDLGVENVKIQMICSDFKIKPVVKDPDGWCLKQEDLKNILVNEYSLSATFSALSKYPGINLKYPSIIEPKKNVSLLIFRSGSIIITGAKDAKDIANCYSFITGVVCKNNSKLFYHDISEEIKQKKKKGKKVK